MRLFTEYFKVADKVQDLASEYLLSKFGTKKTSNHKSDSHYGIQEDIECNNIYEQYLIKNTPEVELYTEEGRRNLQSELVWVIDPIEGTSNYKSGNPFWATQIALLHNNEPVASVVNAPCLRQKFTAVRGSGAFMNGKNIKPTDLTEINLALLDMCRGTKDIDKDWLTGTLAKTIKKVRTSRIFGSSGLQTCYAAAGITDIFINSGSQIYDVIPGMLIAKEAGAVVLNLKGEKWQMGDEGYIVSNDILATELLKLI